ncbi:MAG TPA: pitrilysin family protein [Candidatus Saccharimonadia bacterium]|nr:pitrilysin family protein [Candidatus Saccharimonadia bacterium]
MPRVKRENDTFSNMIHTVHQVKLSNGARGLFIDIPDASVMNFEINFRAGEYLVEVKKTEAPHLMEHMLLGANQLIPKSKFFQAEFEKNGAYCNASTGTYDIVYEAECADFEWHRIAKLLLLAIDKPLFLREEFNSEFGNVKEELVYLSNNHFRQLSIAMRQAFGLCAQTDQARVKLMSNVKLKDVRNHYKNTHFTSNMRFVIGGKLPKERRDQILDHMNKMSMQQGTGRLVLPKENPKRIENPIFITNDSVKNLYFYLDTFLKRKMNIVESYAAQLLNIILTETYYSKILGTAREKGLAYNVNSNFHQLNGNTNLWLGVQISPENIIGLMDIVVKEFGKVFDGKISQKDIKAAKQYSLGRFQREGQTVGSIVSTYSTKYFYDQKVYEYFKFPERIEAVKQEDIVKVARELFSQKIWGIGALGIPNPELINKVDKKVSKLWA